MAAKISVLHYSAKWYSLIATHLTGQYLIFAIKFIIPPKIPILLVCERHRKRGPKLKFQITDNLNTAEEKLIL